MKRLIVIIALLAFFALDSAVAQSNVTGPTPFLTFRDTQADAAALIPPLPPTGCFFLRPALIPYSSSCGITEHALECPPPACDTCRDYEVQYTGDCDITELRFTIEGCHRICGEVVNPPLDNWDANRTNCDDEMVILTSANPPSSNLKPNHWFRFRICGTALSGKTLHIQGVDCNLSLCIDTFTL